MNKILKADGLFKEALKNLKIRKVSIDINTIHKEAYNLMIIYKNNYYEKNLEEYLKNLNLPKDVEEKVLNALLKQYNDRYSNIIEALSRSLSQSFQPISGKLAELCAEYELQKNDLKYRIDYEKNKNHTDIIIYYKSNKKIFHRIEVKNVSLRERATRGLIFDGDSLLGFFNQPNEFTEENVRILNESCKTTGGYCYVPPELFDYLVEIYEDTKIDRFKKNIDFGRDMKYFVENGILP